MCLLWPIGEFYVVECLVPDSQMRHAVLNEADKYEDAKWPYKVLTSGTVSLTDRSLLAPSDLRRGTALGAKSNLQTSFQ